MNPFLAFALWFVTVTLALDAGLKQPVKTIQTTTN